MAKGRPKGSPNKVSGTLKTRIKLFVERNFDGLQDEYDLLQPKDKLTFIKDLIPFVVPKMTAMDAKVSLETKLKDLSELELIELAQRMLENGENEEG